MISKNDIISLSRLHNIRPWQEEKRYMQALILNSLFNYPLVFKGGTYLWLFHGLRRFSEDLDFTSNSELDNNIPENVNRDITLLGINNELKIIKNNDITLSFRIISNGPLYSGVLDRTPVYVEISKREKIINKPLALKFDFPEYNLPVRILSGMSLDEVSSEKVRAIYTRRKPRDIYDLFFLITTKGIKFNKEMINKKLEYYNISFNKKEFIEEIMKQKDYFNKTLKGIVMEELPDINYIIKIIESWLDKDRVPYSVYL
jgi:predicted nucleotidyltransferase component of viral defense system